MLSRDTLERLSYLLGIYKALQILLPDPAAADAWVRRPNAAPLFAGRSALDRMLAGNVSDLSAVRQLPRRGARRRLVLKRRAAPNPAGAAAQSPAPPADAVAPTPVRWLAGLPHRADAAPSRSTCTTGSPTRPTSTRCTRSKR